MKKWTLPEALDLVRYLQPGARERNYHITIGGGVINNGESSKDLDLWILPLNGYEPDPIAITEWLYGILGPGRPLRDSPDYHVGSCFHAREAHIYDLDGQRIDVFVQ